jgi:mannose-6-phosphate isomerase-like protein (cupin superfamily)
VTAQAITMHRASGTRSRAHTTPTTTPLTRPQPPNRPSDVTALCTATAVNNTRAPTSRSSLARSGPTLAGADDAYHATFLSALAANARCDLYRIVATPDAARESEPHTAGCREYVVISSGRAEVGPADEPVLLATGDFLSYPADVPHVFRARTARVTAVLVQQF